MTPWQPRRTLVLGDVHGAHKALVQVFDRAGFDPQQDLLVSLGDLTDYHPDSAEVISALMDLPHHVAIRGNHDIWVEEWLQTGQRDHVWLHNGGEATYESLHYLDDWTQERFRRFFARQERYFVDGRQRLFVHAGIYPGLPMDMQTDLFLYWERQLWHAAIAWEEGRREFPEHPFHEIYIGHTPTTKFWPEALPKQIGNIWNMDTGMKRGGRLSLMDVDTKECWQSDWQAALYPLS